MRTAPILLALLLVAPLAGSAELATAVETQHASLIGTATSRLAPAPSPAVADPGRDFALAMANITEGLPDLIVTSKARSDADQARLRSQGYAPHRHSQHRLGLAWDLAAPLEVLELVEERARTHGFTAIRMRSPVSGRVYLHVQRYARSPLRGVVTAALDAALVREMEAPPSETSTGRDGDPTAGIEESEPNAEAATIADTAAATEAIDVPRPVGVTGFEFPRRLLARKARGTIVLLVELSAGGEVEELRIDSSDLPAFESFVAREVKRWKFTPFTREGRAVAATARLPIPIHIN